MGALRLYCGDSDLAEELAQETLVRVCAHWPKVVTMEYPQAWAHRVAINLANSALRRRRVRRRHQAREVVAEQTAADALAVTRVDLLRCLATLPPRQRAAVVLRYHVGFSALEVASLLGVSPGAVRMLTLRAKEALAAGLSVQLPSESPNRGEHR